MSSNGGHSQNVKRPLLIEVIKISTFEVVSDSGETSKTTRRPQAVCQVVRNDDHLQTPASNCHRFQL